MMQEHFQAADHLAEHIRELLPRLTVKQAQNLAAHRILSLISSDLLDEIRDHANSQDEEGRLTEEQRLALCELGADVAAGRLDEDEALILVVASNPPYMLTEDGLEPDAA